MFSFVSLVIGASLYAITIPANTLSYALARRQTPAGASVGHFSREAPLQALTSVVRYSYFICLVRVVSLCVSSGKVGSVE